MAACLPNTPKRFSPTKRKLKTFSNQTLFAQPAKAPVKISDLLFDLPPAASSLPTPRFINLRDSESCERETGSIASELTQGLTAKAAALSPKFFYNTLGSKLFEAITALDEYYPTRTEAGIFQAASPQIVGALAKAGLNHPCLIDLGAGNCAKALALMPVLKPQQYVPVDISADFLRDAAGQVQNSFPALDIVGVGMDFSAGLRLPSEVQLQERVYFYPGSSLGNFQPKQALAFLRNIADKAQGKARGLLLGSRGRIVVEDNYFHIAGAAILFEGDANYWFEQSGVRDVVIRGNLFENGNYGCPSWGAACIAVGSGIPRLGPLGSVGGIAVPVGFLLLL